MSVKIDGNNYQYAGYSPVKEQQKASKAEEVKSDAKVEEAAVAEKKGKSEDSYVKAGDKIEISSEKVAEARANRVRNTDAFRVMAEALFKGQAEKAGKGSGNNKLKDILKGLTGADKLADGSVALEDDPTWGVEAVAKRIVDFAKNLANGDDSKIDMLLDAVKKGFGAAKDQLGGELPSISQKTYDRVMEMFDEWKNPKSAAVEE